MKNIDRKSVYTRATETIVAQLRNGTAPWIQPWGSPSHTNTAVPHNALTGNVYRGMNTVLLWGAPYNNNGWLTYKQAQQAGGNVRKGEKGSMVVFWKFNKYETEDGEQKSSALCRSYTVFNTDQCDGLNPEKLKQAPPPVDPDPLFAGLYARANINHGGDRAFYAPAFDAITLPTPDTFQSRAEYQATALHELSHWTGHVSRLNRDLTCRFGSNAYAMEELIAELSAAMTCAALGIAGKLQHAEYLASWIKTLEADHRAIFTVASRAQAAADYLLDRAQPQALAA